MIFDPRTADRIAAGRKVQHRIPRRDPQAPDSEPRVIVRTPAGEVEERPVSAFAKTDGPRLDRLMPVTVMVSNPDLGYQRGTTRRPRREGKVVCRVRLLSATRSFLHEATEQDAHKEGHQDLAEFIEDWRRRYGEGPGIPGTPTYPIEIPVWVLEFRRDEQHRPRLLAKASDVNRGYTESPVAALEEEGEAVGDEWLARFAQDSYHDKVARLVKAEQRVKERALEDRLAAVREAARRDGVDISSPLRVIERQLERAEGRLHGKAA